MSYTMSVNSVKLARYSIGLGDRFAQEAEAQLRACIEMAERGVEVIPVWNKSNREHLTVGSEPASVRAAAEAAIRKAGWNKPWHVDADHIRLDTVDRYIPHCDFFTIDVADAIGKPAPVEVVRRFGDRHPELIGQLTIPGVEPGLAVTRQQVEHIAGKYLAAVQEAGRIYRHIAAAKGAGRFITEVSMDETAEAQTPLELLVILAALADEGVPLQTIAPKFTGRFNKGVDYVGDLRRFEQEFNVALAVIAFAVRQYGLPDNLKLSIHSGSDKFSLFPVMARALRRHNAGLHLKTAGTTWLEELIGLAETGGEGLALAREIYAEALEHVDELCAPYASVIDIDRSKLPAAQVVAQWSGAQFAAAVRHDPTCPNFNPHVRQLLHVAYKIAAKKGDQFLALVRSRNGSISRNVTFNLLERHLKPLFLGNGIGVGSGH
ncbi:MAG: tagaturonate epimerase family protein [Verrucomicrobiae bacterium]|nr:tagaturonate epimerase family protein [Verrucomicrobiae bacterium]